MNSYTDWASQAYLKHLYEIVKSGSNEEARGLKFREIIGAKYIVPMANPVPSIPERKLGFKFAAAEPWWILSGKNLLSDIHPFGKMAPYSDDGYFMSGAYGPKIVDQLAYVCKTLADDKGSRQAVINIWRERPGPSKDIPCTLSLQFLIRAGMIHCVATMRSSDAYMGLPYDSILFSLTSAYVLSIMRHHYGCGHSLELGKLHLTLGSAHLYDRDFESVDRIITAWDYNLEDVDFNDIASLPPSQFLDRLYSCATDDSCSGILEL